MPEALFCPSSSSLTKLCVYHFTTASSPSQPPYCNTIRLTLSRLKKMTNLRIRYVWPKMPLMHNCIKSRWVAEKMLWVTARDNGQNISQIARSAGVSRNTICKWLARYSLKGMNGLMPQRPGAKTGTHPSALKHDLVAKIIALCDQEGYGIRSITQIGRASCRERV